MSHLQTGSCAGLVAPSILERPWRPGAGASRVRLILQWFSEEDPERSVLVPRNHVVNVAKCEQSMKLSYRRGL